MMCEYILKLLIIAACTLFWMWAIAAEYDQRRKEAEKELDDE